MVIFNSYVSLPEGDYTQSNIYIYTYIYIYTIYYDIITHHDNNNVVSGGMNPEVR